MIFLLMACNAEGEIIPDSSNEIFVSVVIGHVTVEVLDVQLRNSVQNYYLMYYPKPDHTYLEVVLSIEDLDASPENTLDWGAENFCLMCEGQAAELVFPRRVIADEHIEYKAGEKLNYDYVYIFSVLDEADFATCDLTFSDGQSVNLASILEVPADFSSTTQSEEKGTVLSGEDNLAFGENSVVSGGSQNSANAIYATVAGGNMNLAVTSHATVGGGRENTATNFYATVGGGYANNASVRDTFIGGGSRNIAGGPRSSVGGGIQNQATAPDTVIAGGAYNQATDDYAFVGGGTQNMATGYASVIGGGAGNFASTDQATISGGLGNQVEGIYGAVGGGYRNLVVGDYAAIPGGSENKAGGDYSFASGQQAVISTEHPGSFVYADATNMEFPSITANEFAVRATGGVRFISAVNADGEALSGVLLPPGSGSWTTLSDQSAKTDITPVNPQAILFSVVDMPITSWSYRGQENGVRHIGPMAQIFYAAFGLGASERYISTVDADGVALAAIQGLYEIVQQQNSLIQTQNDRLTEIESRMIELDQLINEQKKSQTSYFLWLGWGMVFGCIILSVWKKGLLYISGFSSLKP